MEKEQYFELKNESKRLAKRIKELKKLVCKGWYKRGLDRIQRQELTFELSRNQFEFRCKHIFLCLCRGRTREQIENNFIKQTDTWLLNRNLRNMCEEYNVDFDCDEKNKVLTIERSWVRQKIAS